MILALALGRLEVEEDLVEADGPGRVIFTIHPQKAACAVWVTKNEAPSYFRARVRSRPSGDAVGRFLVHVAFAHTTQVTRTIRRVTMPVHG